ncbi:MAG: DnaB-like helicase C-terminal domain-containing protein [Rhodomicrobium sp.]
MQGLAEIIVAKHRHGPIGTVKLAFSAPLTRFSDLTRNHEAQS